MDFVFVTKKNLEKNIYKEYTELANLVMLGKNTLGFMENFTPKTAKAFLLKKLGKRKAGLSLVYIGKKLIGSGIIHQFQDNIPHFCLMKSLMVHPEYQSQGLGKKIIRVLEKEAITRGFTDIILNTWDFEGPEKFYRKCGYTKIGVIPHFIKDRKGIFHDSQLFVKKIGDY